MKNRLSSRNIQSRLVKIHNAELALYRVRRVNNSTFQRVEGGIVMMIPKRFTLNRVHDAFTEIAEVYPWSEDYIRQKGDTFICYRKDLARALALYGFLYKHVREFPVYQAWGKTVAA